MTKQLLRYFPDWYGAVHQHASPDLIDIRLRCVAAGVADLEPQEAVDLVSALLAPELEESAKQRERLVETFAETDRSFPVKTNRNLVDVMLAACIASAIDKGGPTAVAASLAIKTTSIDGAAFEVLPSELHQGARAFLRVEAVRQREQAHAEIPPISGLTPVAQPKAVAPVAIDETTENWDAMRKNDKAILASVAAIGKSVERVFTVVEHLRKESAAIFASAGTRFRDPAVAALQEETQVLWWLFGAWSEAAGCSFDGLRLPDNTLPIACEFTEFMRFVPGHPRTRPLLARALVGSQGSEPFALSEVVGKAPIEWRKGLLVQEDVPTCAQPLHFAIARSAEASGDNWHRAFESLTRVSPKLSLTPLVWAEQLCDEILLRRVVADGAS